MKTIKGDLILKKDYSINDNLTVEGDIICKGGLWNINALDINALDINAGNINAKDINTWDINALDINALDINALNINALDINTWDINAEDINAWNINAWDISYYAFCVAYGGITCTSIKGRRENHAKPICLDGKLTIKKKQKEAKGR